MLKNYLKIAWRNLLRNRVSSIINIGGLSIGMAVAMLIGLWINEEFLFNKNFPHYQRIATVLQNNTMNGEIGTGINVPPPMGAELRKSFGSDFKQVVMASWNETHILSAGDKKISKSGSFFEPGVTGMLSLHILTGDKHPLDEPASIILSAATAKDIFGKDDPVGKTIKIDNNQDVKVTAVYENIASNSSFGDVQYIMPWQLMVNTQGLDKAADPWRCNCYFSYVQLNENADIDKVSAKIKDIKLSKVDKSELKQKPSVFLYPMSKWYLYAEFKNGYNTGGRIQYIWLFGIIGLFVLLLACINFMNLSTARSEKRAREVGIRKSVGSLRGQLISQFYTESLVVAIVAFMFSLLLVQLTLPFFNDIAGKKIAILWGNPLFWLAGLVFSCITGLIAGSYPALYLSSFNPVKVLKGVFRAGRFAAVPRRVLVVIQFTVSVVLIIGTIVVFRQIQFAKDRPIGYSRNGLITLQMSTGDIHKHFETVKNELINGGAIANLAEAGSPPTAVWSTNAGFDWNGKDPGQAVEFPNIDVSYEYGKTVGWQFKDGRDFSREFLTDSNAFVINETAAKFIGWKNPVGEILKWDGTPYRVIGVIKDMVVESPYSQVRPTLFHLSSGAGNLVIAKIHPAVNTAKALEMMETVFKKYNPAQPFDYQFVDETYAKKFGDEQRTGKLAGFFAILAIFISCLGLFGMASFVAEQRTKEIGVRKILGASVLNLWGLLSKDFVVLVILSCAIAIPAGYYFLHDWLQKYEYRTEMQWWIFAVSGAGALVITLLTVSFQAIKAAIANPVKSLRTE